MAKKKPARVFKFHKNDCIGLPSAEQDAEFLRTCFVDTGDFGLLENFSEHRMIVLGRTGAGKSALFEWLKQLHEDRVIEVEPANLALTYVGHSAVLNNLSALGINLDPFFALLWRHVFTVEILTRYFKQYVPQNRSLWEWLLGFFMEGSREDKRMQEAITYLREWGEKFWLETEYRVKEITEKIETQLTDALKAQLGNKYASLASDWSQVQKLSEEEKIEVRHHAQQVVSKAQVKDLNQVLKMLEYILADRQKQYYIVVDRLDENWVEEKLRYRLIMALIQTAKEFIGLKNAKVIIALRRDLVDRVFRLARDAGFQEEKVQALYLQLHWSKEELLRVLDLRVRRLVSRRYTKGAVTYKDLLPASFHGMDIDEYIFRLAPRPRDVIAFFNACIAEATNHAKLNTKQLSAAEGAYSTGRLRALADEWIADYQDLISFTRIVSRRQSVFKLGSLTKLDVENLCLDIVAEHPEGRGDLNAAARSLVDGVMQAEQFRTLLLKVFYRIGFVGLKTAAHETFVWATDRQSSLAALVLDDSTSVQVAPPYIRALGVNDKVHVRE